MRRFLLFALVVAGSADLSARWHVAELNGAPALYHDGNPVPPMMFWQWQLQEKDVKDLSAVGMEIFSMFGSVPHYEHPYWLKDGSLDMSFQDTNIDSLLSIAPRASFLPRLFATAPDWWIATHPEEKHLLSSGELPQSRESFASLKSRKEISPMYRKAIRHLMDRYGDNLIGIHVANGPWGENFSWDVFSQVRGEMEKGGFGDVSEPMRLAFVSYLRRKYGGDITRLRKAFNDPNALFETVTVPLKDERLKLDTDMWRDPSRSRRIIDYFECQHQVSVEMIDHYCGIVKAESKGDLATLAFYGYVRDGWWAQECDHCAPSKMYLSKHLDMLSAPHTYRRRGLGEDGVQRQYLASAALHGKLFFDEGDDMTHLEMAKANPDRRCCARTMADSLALLYREFGMTVTHGTGLWYMDLTRNTFRDPALVDAVGRMHRWSAESLKHDRSHHSEVAVISQPESAFYHGYRSTPGDTVTERLYVDQMGEFYRAGAPFDWYLAEDLAAVEKGRAKVVCFLDCQYLSDEQYALAIRLKESGRRLVFFHAPGYASQEGLSWDRVKRLTGGETFEELRFRDHNELREIYRGSGVHIYTDSDVILSANRSWLMLHTRSEADYRVLLPAKSRRITEITTEKTVAENVDRFTYHLPKHSTAVFLLEEE